MLFSSQSAKQFDIDAVQGNHISGNVHLACITYALPYPCTSIANILHSIVFQLVVHGWYQTHHSFQTLRHRTQCRHSTWHTNYTNMELGASMVKIQEDFCLKKLPKLSIKNCTGGGEIPGKTPKSQLRKDRKKEKNQSNQPCTLYYYTHLHLRLPLSFYTSRTEHDIETKLTSVNSLAEAQKALEARGCKFSVTNLSIVPHTLGILTTNITCCINFL